MPPRKSSCKNSNIWNFFTEKVKSDQVAICQICKQELSFKSTSANLKKHMQRKHPTIHIEPNKSIIKDIETPGPAESEPTAASQESQDQCQPSTSNLESNFQAPKLKPPSTQTSISSFVRKRKIGLLAKKEIDQNLMLLFTHDYQPFSVVEDFGFKKFVESLNPAYNLPSRNTISSTLLPLQYEQVYNKTKILAEQINSVVLTTDCWTSNNTESFLAVTAHFISEDFEIKTLLLDCLSFPESHTSKNLAGVLQKIIDEWNLEGKILIIISDNASNIKKAIRDDLKLKHLGCFAHNLNLICQNAIKPVAVIIDKVKSIVGFFKRSTTATAKFSEQQKHLQKDPKRLIQEVSTRWNSTYYMLERFHELEDPIRTTMALLDKDLPIITGEEWLLIRELVKILKPMEELTKMISGEKYITGSSVIIFTLRIMDIYSEMKKKSFFPISLNVISNIIDGIKMRFGDVEKSNSLILSTFLDPRYKNIGFSSTQIGEEAKQLAISLLTKNIKEKINATEKKEEKDNPGPSFSKTTDGDIFSFWTGFDEKVSKVKPSGTANSRAIIEIQRYLEEPPLKRTECPLNWWRTNSYNFPYLSELVKQKMIPICTSVPCERLFSKSGQLLSDRRNRLSANKVKKLLFINYNS